jgi:hypothetical protein
MSRRICLLVLAVSFALAAPAATFAQSSSQAQYQGVAPETSAPVTGSGGSTGGGTTSSGTGGSQTGGTKSGGTTSGASGNGGGGGGGASAPQFSPPAVTPSASTQTAPFSGGDWIWIVIALAALTGLGFLLRYAMRMPTST